VQDPMADRDPCRSPADERAAVLRALTPVLDAVNRMNAGADLTASLQAVLERIVEAIGFGAGAIDYVRTDGTMEIVAVTGPAAAREALLGAVIPRGALERELEVAQRWGRLRFLPHGVVPVDTDYHWVPDLPIPDAPDGWHPDDTLLAPLYGAPGELIGILSVDMPRSGRLPDAFQLQLLELLAGQAETALQNARRASRLRASEESFRLAFEATAVGMGLVSLDHQQPLRILRANRAFEQIAESTGSVAVGALSDLLDPADPDRDPHSWSDAIRTAPSGVYRAEKLLCGNGAPWADIVATVLPLHSTEAGRAIVQVEDITERRRVQGDLHIRATSDHLTGLGNRARLGEHFTAATAAARAGGAPGALLFCDLDDFKSVNDVFGHLAGDAVLRACSQRLARNVREVDEVFRLGGDEFAIVLHGVSPEELDRFVARIKADVARPIEHEGRHLRIRMSVGGTIIDGACDSVNAVLGAADAAMYRDKRRKLPREPRPERPRVGR
jgi:diguanylate cyclase (GGDEF)-like protein